MMRAVEDMALEYGQTPGGASRVPGLRPRPFHTKGADWAQNAGSNTTGAFNLRATTRCAALLLTCAGLTCTGTAMARGPSPYLPLNLAPAIERKMERVLILAGVPVIRRPIPTAVLLDALPKACPRDPHLCREVRRYLARYTRDSGVTQAQVQLAHSAGASHAAIPDDHGMDVKSAFQVAAGALYQIDDHALVTAGVLGYQGRVTPTGTVISLGFDFAQLDIGWRDHWFSPNSDSSMLISTQAPTLPSITLSNYAPISPLGITYEVFLSRLSTQDNIVYHGGTTSGHPNLTGLQVGLQPVDGYSLAINRVMQFGGGARGGTSASQFFNALFKNSNAPDSAYGEEFGNQVASVTSSIVFPGTTPFAVRMEYAGEDNAYKGSYRLGDTDLTLGLDFPLLWQHFDLNMEVSEWQNTWYTNHLYPEGLSNDGHALGHWFGDERVPGDAIGGHSQSVKFGWHRDSGDYLQATVRTLAYDQRWRFAGTTGYDYATLRELGLSYTTEWRDHSVSGDLFVGRDVFGNNFARVAATVDLVGAGGGVDADANDSGYAMDDDAGTAGDDDSAPASEWFVDLGATGSVVHKILDVSIPDSTTSAAVNYHAGIGARRQVSDHGELGARLELDHPDGHSLLSVRAFDYRHRFGEHFAVTGFLGAGRYLVGLPAYGWYMGAGAQYVDVLPHWDLGLDFRHYDKLGRDKTLPDDPPVSPIRTREFFDMNAVTLYLSRTFH
jgi:hypothetical protein